MNHDTHVHRSFTLHVLPEAGDYGISLTVASNGAEATVASLDPSRLNRIRPSITQAVTSSGHQRTTLSHTRTKPIELSEDAGVRLTLITLATAPLTKPKRVEAVRLGVEAMTGEEALYWYAHCTGRHATRALKALRTLLADE